MTPPRLVLLCGLPGSGKTTVARRLAVELGAVRLSPDEWMAGLGVDLWDADFRSRLHDRFWLLTCDLLAGGTSVILENGFWHRAERDAARTGARALGALVELRHLDVPVDELARRLAARNTEDRADTVELTREHLLEWLPMFEAPAPEELGLFDPPVDQASGSKTS